MRNYCDLISIQDSLSEEENSQMDQTEVSYRFANFVRYSTFAVLGYLIFVV